MEANQISSGNAIALFLKSQRKWDNPPLQDDVRDQFRKLCNEKNYDASKSVLTPTPRLKNPSNQISDTSFPTAHISSI